MKRKIAAILAADVVGYSRLVAQDESRALQDLLACRDIFSEFVARGGGRIFNTAGDSVLSEFPSAVDALVAAIDIQDCIRTQNQSQPSETRMLFRMGMTIGDVVERDGDLLGDGVNVAARLEGLAEPGGICVSQIVYEQVLNKVSAKFRDIGLRTVKNMPSPIHVYAFEGATATLDRKSWSLMGGFRRRIPLTLAIGACLALSGLIMMVALNRGRFPSLGSGSATNDGTKAVASGLGIYGVIDKPLKGSPALTGLMLFKPEQTPFVSDSNRVRIAKDLTARGANSALAISIKGGFGAISDRSTPEIARNDAITLCNDSRLGECTIYELNGVISWPRPIPLPPKPWIDPTAVRKPFDATRLRAIKDTDVSRITQGYPHATLYKALALGPPGIWWYRSQRSDEEEATRVVLEQCGDDAGTACRVVAVNDEFVVDETTAPVDVLYDSVARCIGLAGASFDAGATSQGISLNEIDANSAIPACRSALAAHPSDTSLQLCLGRAIERVIFCRRRLSPSIKVPPMEAMVLRLTFLAWPTTVVNSVYRRSRPSPPRCIENLLTPVIQTAQKTWV